MMGQFHSLYSGSISRCQQRCAQNTPSIALQSLYEHPLDRFGASAIATTGPAIALGGADLRPVRSPIDGAAVSRRIHECFQHQQRLRELFQPVALQPSPATRQNPRSEVRIMMAGQNQKTRIVRHQLQSVGAVRPTPADPLIARSTLERRRRKTQQPQPVPVHRRHVANRVADLAQRSKIVMLLHPLLEFTLPLAFDRCHRQRGVIHSCFPFQTAMPRSLNEFLPNVQLWTYLFILYYESAIDDFVLQYRLRICTFLNPNIIIECGFKVISKIFLGCSRSVNTIHEK